MTPEQAIENIEDALNVWWRWALEPDEKTAIGKALDALEVLRQAHRLSAERGYQTRAIYTSVAGDEVMDELRAERDAAVQRADRLAEALSDPVRVAQMFHEAYERLAPAHGYETRRESAVPWNQVPPNNRQLMITVAGVVCAALAAASETKAADDPRLSSCEAWGTNADGIVGEGWPTDRKGGPE